MRSAEAFTSVVKHSVPRSSRAEPKTPQDVPTVKAVERAGNARGTGARRLFRWQKSVVRIARLVPVSSSRSQGRLKAPERRR